MYTTKAKTPKKWSREKKRSKKKGVGRGRGEEEEKEKKELHITTLNPNCLPKTTLRVVFLRRTVEGKTNVWGRAGDPGFEPRYGQIN
jgi:hypothetical protein